MDESKARLKKLSRQLILPFEVATLTEVINRPSCHLSWPNRNVKSHKVYPEIRYKNNGDLRRFAAREANSVCRGVGLPYQLDPRLCVCSSQLDLTSFDWCAKQSLSVRPAANDHCSWERTWVHRWSHQSCLLN